MEEPCKSQSRGSLRVIDMTERLHFPFSLSCIGEGNSDPLQCSCLENPRDGGAWWAAIYGVAQSRTRLKQLSSSSSRFSEAMLRPHEAHHGVDGFTTRHGHALSSFPNTILMMSQFLLFRCGETGETKNFLRPQSTERCNDCPEIMG